MAPVEGRPPRYRLYLQGAGEDPDGPALEALAAGLEAGLRENPHYGYAVGLGQLAPAEVQVLPSQGESGWDVFERRGLARGQKAGGIKPAALDPWPGWAEEFAPLSARPAGAP